MGKRTEEKLITFFNKHKIVALWATIFLYDNLIRHKYVEEKTRDDIRISTPIVEAQDNHELSTITKLQQKK